MKTLTKTLFASLFAAVLLTSSAMTSFAANPVEVTTEAKSFNKIWVAGNVKIILTQSDKEGVFAGEDFDASQVSVKSKGQTLYINSTSGREVTINVSVKDLQRIAAAGNAVVVMSNNFDVKYLQVFLSQNANAKVNVLSGSLYTVVSDDAVLKMSGSTNEHTLIASNMKNVKFDNFVSLKTDRQDSKLAMNVAKVAANKTK